MNHGKRRGMEWGDRKETIWMWEGVGIVKIESMETWKMKMRNKILGKLEVWEMWKI